MEWRGRKERIGVPGLTSSSNGTMPWPPPPMAPDIEVEGCCFAGRTLVRPSVIRSSRVMGIEY